MKAKTGSIKPTKNNTARLIASQIEECVPHFFVRVMRTNNDHRYQDGEPAEDVDSKDRAFGEGQETRER